MKVSFLKNSLVLWEFVQHILIVFTPLPTLPRPLPPQLCVFFLFESSRSICAAKYSYMYGLPLGNRQFTRGYTLRESFFFLPKQLTIAKGAMVSGGISFPTPLSVLKFGLLWACPGSVSLFEDSSEHPQQPSLIPFIMTWFHERSRLTVLNMMEANQANIFLVKLAAHLKWLFLARIHSVETFSHSTHVCHCSWVAT